MTREQLEAHKRLLTILPAKTHVLRGDIRERRKGCGRKTEERMAALRKRARNLKSRGWNVPRIAKILRMSRQTVYTYLK